jgi:hypothetical protein
MGARKENRDRKAMAERIDSEQNEPCGLSRRGLSELLTSTDNTIIRLEHRADVAEAELIRAKKYIMRLEITLTAQKFRTAEALEELRKTEASRVSSGEAFFAKDRAHRKLSAVVRLALTPEQYHFYRAQI